MIKSIFYKEWIKTRWILLISLVVSTGFVLYSRFRIARVVELQGVSHVWEILLTKDIVFIEALRYVPLAIGVILGMSQFYPEMHQKRLKLTLHLPVAPYKILFTSMFFGFIGLLVVFLLNNVIIWLYLHQILATEFTARIMLTALPWYIAGIAGYALAIWVCLEPTWKRRIVNVLFAVGSLKLFFLVSYPEAYHQSVGVFAILSLIFIGFAWLSVSRFKTGAQD